VLLREGICEYACAPRGFDVAGKWRTRRTTSSLRSRKAADIVIVDIRSRRTNTTKGSTRGRALIRAEVPNTAGRRVVPPHTKSSKHTGT